MEVEKINNNAYRAIEPCEPSVRPDKIELRYEQEDAVKKALARFSGWMPGKEVKFLWNAKMRFGKTVSALKLAKDMGQLEKNPVRRTIIVTHRPDVEDNWREDYEKIFTEEERKTVKFATKFDGDNNDIATLIEDETQPLVFFASLQYLRGSKLVGGKKSSPIKDKILNAKWDLVVVDESHEGTTTDLGSGVIEYLTGGHKSRLLSLSGTPFNLMEKYTNSEIFTWDYVQEQERKLAWANKTANRGKSEAENPYRTLPKMEIRILEPKKVMHWQDGFDLREFFRVDDSKEARAKLSEEIEAWKSKPKHERGSRPTYKFVHEQNVIDFLSQLADDSDPKNSFPFANLDSRAQLRHTFWVLPGVKECQAMKSVLEAHPDYNDPYNGFKIINVAGSKEGDEERASALDKVKATIKELTESGSGLGTITLSCGRLTTGVTVPEWTAVIYLKGSTSTKAAPYMQTIFRVQSPWEFDDYADGEHKMKKTCYVFDFDPTRALTKIAETAKYSAKGRKETVTERAQTDDDATRTSLRRFLDLCQVCDMSGKMIERDTSTLVQRLVEHLHNVAIEKAVTSGFDNQSIYNFDALLKADPDKLERIRNIVGQTDPEAKKDKNKPSSTYKDLATVEKGKGSKQSKGKNELTPEQIAAKEAADRLKQEKDKRVAILRGIAIRIPLMMYGAEGNYESTITLDNITNPKVVDDRSWREFMPKDVTRELFLELKEYFDREVFDGAGRRYRELTREADSMPPTERVARIAEIQSWFRNPNSETVLTPWKVVNRHLSDTIGGYCFFNEQFTGPNQVEVAASEGSGRLFDFKETNEPRFVDRGDVTRQAFRVADNDHSTLLEINSKSGLYPLYLVYTLYRMRLERYLKIEVINSETDLSLEEQQVIWDDAVAMCVHIICNTPMAEYITRRTLLGFRQCDNEIDREAYEASHPGMKGFLRRNLRIRNIDLVEQARDKDRRAELVDQLRDPKFWNKNSKTKEPMTFDAVVSNPPYMIKQERTSDIPVYHNFMDLAEEISAISTFITPARFLFNAGKTPAEWNKKILNDTHIKVIWVENSKDIFPGVDLKGAVTVTLRNKKEEYSPIGIYSRFSELSSIRNKVVAREDFEDITGIFYPQNKFNLDTLYKDFPECRNLIGSGGREKRLTTSIFTTLNIFSTECAKEGELTIYGLINNDRVVRSIPSKYIADNGNLNFFKVLLPKSNGSGAIGECLSTPLCGEPLCGYTQSFISFGAFSKKEEAEAAMKYFKTKFARVLLGVLKVTQDNPKEVWINVPLQDFTSESDVRWEKSIPEIDQYLYKKYGLIDKEIAFIETMIKPME